ncbi:ISAon1 family transposase [Labilibacter marinus]|uniref:ISAon1 family transposase n=1 Tax=Labilibacter marinus TaxID=1477105 RepID=UPI0008314164|nr:transposase [Labilibacter marinus]
MDCNAVSIKSLGLYFGVNSDLFSRQYKNKLSDYRAWDQYSHACEYLVFPQNMGKFLSIDETSLSNGELYTILTNKSASGKKGTIIGIFKGVEAYSIISRIREHIPKQLLRQVEEITLDLSPTMNAIAKSCFANAKRVADRFHVQSLTYDAVQQIRIEYRWEAIEQENNEIKHARETDSEYSPEILSNGDSPKQLLARSRYLLFKSPNAWTSSQKERASILFQKYPKIAQAYELAMELKEAYNHRCQKEVDWLKLAHWAEKVRQTGFKSFNTIANTFFNYYDNISNYYTNRSTNAAAESFNAKIKDFRRQFRGVVDVRFFLYRLTKIYA